VYLFFGVVALLFVIGLGARQFRPDYLRRVGTTEAAGGPG
jgi:hypothetical protein